MALTATARVSELVDHSILPDSLRHHSETLRELGQVYKQINAPFGKLAKNTLRVSTFAILSNSNGDETYAKLENKIASWTTERDSLTATIKSMLEDAEFHGQAIDQPKARQIIHEAKELLDRADECAEHPGECIEDE